MGGGIFVSYRRDDSRHAAGRLLDRLRQIFNPHQLFMDVDNVAPGLDFVMVLTEQVAACDVMLVVIGPNWLDARDEKGKRRLDNSDDFVRIEVQAALERNVRVIPVLVDGAAIPSEHILPEPLRPLARRQSVRLTHERFGSEADSLARSLREVVQPAGSDGGAPAPAVTPGRREGRQAPTFASSTERPARAANEVRELSEGAPPGSTTTAMPRALGLGVVGLMVGFGLSVFYVYGPVLGWLPEGHGPWEVFAFSGLLAIIWFSLAAWLTRGAATSQLWWTASAASWAAALFHVAFLLGGLYIQGYIAGEGRHPGETAIAIALGAAFGAYVLAVRLFLWKAIVGGDRL
jgi:hypothetical protein